MLVCALSCDGVMCCRLCVWLLSVCLCGLCEVSRVVLSGVCFVRCLCLFCVVRVRAVLS